MSSNILNKSAMEVLHSLELKVPVLSERVGRLNGQLDRTETAIHNMGGDVGDIKVGMAAMQGDIKLMTQNFEQSELLCPLREVAAELPDLRDKVDAMENTLNGNCNEVAEMRGNMKWYAGGLAAIALVIIAAGETISAVLRGL